MTSTSSSLSDAKTACQSDGGRLFDEHNPDDSQKMDHIKQQISNFLAAEGFTELFVGKWSQINDEEKIFKLAIF